MNSNLSITNTQSSFFGSWIIGEDRRHLTAILLFILVTLLHIAAKSGLFSPAPVEQPKIKIVEIELLAPPPPVAPPAPITPPTPTPPKPEPPKPKPVPPKPKPVPKPKPKPVQVPKPDDFKIPEPTPIKIAPTPPVPYTPPVSPRPAAPAPSKPSTNAAPAAHGNQRPTCMRCPHPHYPEQARRRNWQGTVKLKIFVDSDGDVKDVQVISSSGYDALDDAAVDDVKDWRFAAGDAGTVRVATQSINFKLDD